MPKAENAVTKGEKSASTCVGPFTANEHEKNFQVANMEPPQAPKPSERKY